jgi:membrane-associated phospholipid phosphatase
VVIPPAQKYLEYLKMSPISLHGWIFTGLLLVSVIVLLLAGQFAVAGMYIVLLVLVHLQEGHSLRVFSPSNPWMRLIFYSTLTILLYFGLSRVIRAMYGPAPALLLVVTRWDRVLRGIDVYLFNDLFCGLAARVIGFKSLGKVLIEILSMAYISLIPFIGAVFWHHSGDTRRLLAFAAGLFSLFGLGFFGYLLVPAQGPIFSVPAELVYLNTSTQDGIITKLRKLIVDSWSIKYDVFPSLHVAISLYAVGFSLHSWSNRLIDFLLCLIALLISLSAIILGYHYFADVLTGVLLALVAFGLAMRQWRHSARLPQ